MKTRILPLALCITSAATAGIDRANFDTSIRPQDDFFLYADGTWIKNHPIPADRSSWSAGAELQENNFAVLHGILEKAEAASNPGFIEKLVGDFYHSGMDQAASDAAGVAPLKAELDRIASIETPGDVVAEVPHLQRIGVPVCFVIASEQDPKNSTMVIAGVGQGGLGLPERDYYLRTDAGSVKLREGYVAHVARMLELAGDSAAEAQTEAQAVMKLETGLAKGSKPAVDLRDPIANYHPLALAEVAKLTPNLNWAPYLEAIGLPAPAVMDIGQPEFMQALDAQFAATPVADWRAYFHWQLIHANADYLSTPIVDENFAFFGKTLTGAPKMRDRWKRVLATVDSSAGEALGQLYVAAAFPPESKVRMLKLIGHLRQALHDRIEKLEWMDDATRAKAIAKLAMFGVKVGYPDRWIDYSTLSVDRGSYVLNVLRANEFNVKLDLAKIGKPVDRVLWGMTPPTVNAYYNPTMNEIVFPAGILQPPFFDAKADDAVNYGGIGAIIGHEMTHGFDDQGRQYDGAGNLSDWWTPESARRFKERSAGIVRQFNGYVPVDTLHINGALTQGENIADLGGVKLAYSAYMASLGGKPGETIDGFTPQQRFFLSYANIWRGSQRPEAIRLQVNTDPHAIRRFRVDGPLSNLPEFAAAFDVPEGAPMRRSGADKVTIW